MDVSQVVTQADRNLEKIWPRICTRKFVYDPPAVDAPAKEIRSWFMDETRSGRALRLIRRLDLSGLGLTEVPLELQGCTKLCFLDLSHNSLAECPAWLKTSLKVLSLEGNPLCQGGFSCEGPSFKASVLESIDEKDEYDFCESES